MKTQDLQAMKPKELAQRVTNLRAQYFTLQEAVRLGKERNHARLSQLRRDIARTLSVLRHSA